MTTSKNRLASSVRIERTGAPLYRDVYKALERSIAEGRWKPGQQIPTEAELERHFNASRGTLRMAISELVRRGWLHRQAGRGTFVLGPSFQSLERYFRYETLSGTGVIRPSNQVLETRIVAADAEVATAMGRASGSKVAWVRRLRCHDSEPFLLIDSYFPMAVWETIRRADFTRYPLYDVFKDDFDLYVVSADEFLRADVAKPEEARMLKVKSGSAVIRLERTACTFENRLVEYRRAIGRADRFRYHVRLE